MILRFDDFFSIFYYVKTFSPFFNFLKLATEFFREMKMTRAKM